MSLTVFMGQFAVRLCAAERDVRLESKAGDYLFEMVPLRPFADDAQSVGERESRTSLDEHIEAFLLDQPPDREDVQTPPGRKPARLKPAQVYAVRQQVD